jgi:hypothetical protein
MFDQVNAAIDDYLAKWNELIAARKDPNNKEFFERLKPTAVGWKVADVAEYDRLVNEWRGACDMIFQKWMNDRWIATLHLKDMMLSGDIKIVKILQRRPGSSDPDGLDNMEFLDMEKTNTVAVLAEENDIKWTEEENGVSKWTSLWFANTEAKLKPETPLDIAREELRQASNTIRGTRFADRSGDDGHVTIPTDVE